MTKKIKPTSFITSIAIAILFSTGLKAQEIQSYKATEIKPYKSEEIKPYKPGETKPVNDDERQQKSPLIESNLQTYFGLYQYWIPGTSYTVPDYSNHQLVLHNSTGTGVLPGGIKINSNGSYIWNSSWDGKIIKGNWRKTGDKDYPIELVNAQEGKTWKVGKSKDKGADIYVWDGSTWYDAKKLHH
ncbi:MAG TPA: hypothetical protein VFT78_16520 [Hanamia sp.]|nr:hypothetical protein [Hanamia sp.]